LGNSFSPNKFLNRGHLVTAHFIIGALHGACHGATPGFHNPHFSSEVRDNVMSHLLLCPMAAQLAVENETARAKAITILRRGSASPREFPAFARHLPVVDPLLLFAARADQASLQPGLSNVTIAEYPSDRIAGIRRRHFKSKGMGLCAVTSNRNVTPDLRMGLKWPRPHDTRPNDLFIRGLSK
jgi:hypothetical protein